MERSNRPRSGTWLVAGMVGFGLLLTAGLFAYQALYAAPFRSLTHAIAERYPGSAPRVDGGKLRLDQPGENVLRIVMKSPFDPADEVRAKSFARDVAVVAAENTDLRRYDAVEVHLYFERPKQQLSQRAERLMVEEIISARPNAPSPETRHE